jgi:hypothetical protein
VPRTFLTNHLIITGEENAGGENNACAGKRDD